MFRRPTMLLVFALVSLFEPVRAAADETLEDLVEEALRANPDLATRRARIAELEALAGVAGAWSDPMVAIEYSNVPVSTLALEDHPMAGLQLRVQQTLRPPSWSRLRRGVLEARAGGARSLLEEGEIQLRASVETLYWQLTLTRQLERVTEEHLARTEDLLGSVIARYEVGKAGQHAVLGMRVLRDRLADELFEFGKRDRELSAAIGRAIARSDGEIETPDTLDPLPPPEDVSPWLEQAIAQRPALDVVRAEIEASRVAADLARADGLPDPTFWLGYRVRTVQTPTDPGTDLASVGVSVPIPLGTGRSARGERSGHLAAASGAEARLEGAIDQLEADLETVHARWVRAYGKALTYRDELLPEARSLLETTVSDYSVDRADFSSLYEAEITLLDLERAQRTATAETHLQHAWAAALLGDAPTGDAP